MGLEPWVAADGGAAGKEAALSCKSLTASGTGTEDNTQHTAHSTPKGPASRRGARKSGESVSGRVLFDALWWWGVGLAWPSSITLDLPLPPSFPLICGRSGATTAVDNNPP